MSDVEFGVLLMGPPKSGKTTFLAALYHVLEQADVEGALRLHHLGEERSYLNRIRNHWLSCEEIGRTPEEIPPQLSMQLVSSDDSDSIVELVVPDLLGESYDRYLEHREWPQEFDDFVRKMLGVLLFVHPDHVRKSTLILEVDQTVPGLVDSDSATDVTEGVNAWGIEHVPTQVKLVELLRLLEHRRTDLPPIQIGLLVSAWDRVADMWDTADLWVEGNMPFLCQYLSARIGGEVRHRVFGISAQGGDLIQDRDKITGATNASDRIIVSSAGQRSHDITAPIRWIMEGM